MASGKIFISYSHCDDDAEIAEEIVLRLRSKLPDRMVFFDKSAISAGDAWETTIEREVPETSAALFLVSPNFLASEFIKKERRMLLEARERDPSVAIIWVCLKASQIPRELLEFQGFCLDIPLTALSEVERQRSLEDIAQRVSEEVRQDADLKEEFTDRVRRMVRKNFDLRLGAKVNDGDHSIVYKAASDEGEYAVKARIARVFEKHYEDAGATLQDHLELCYGLSEVNPTFIPLKGGLVQGDLQILISGFVQDISTLRDVLDDYVENGEMGLPPDIARFVIGQLASALADYHNTVDRPYGILRPSDVLVDLSNWHVRIPSFRMATIEFEQSRDTDRIMLTNEVLSYLAYEQHETLVSTKRADQCSLGLLAIELLEGSPPVKVRSITDLGRARAFFETAAAPRPAWERLSRETAKVIQQMVNQNWRKRHVTMRKAADDLGVLGELSEDNRRVAKRSYSNFKDIRHQVIEPFYEAFFEVAEIKAMFAHEKFSLEEQHKKLKQALLYLLNFRERDRRAEPTTLTDVREIHEAKSISLEHYAFFEDCLLKAIQKVGKTSEGNAGQASEEVRIAWQKTMRPGLAYMSEKLGSP